MADLKTNYKDDILDTSKNTRRKYQQIENTDGTISFSDVTEYSQVGSEFLSEDVNAITTAVNSLSAKLGTIKLTVTADGLLNVDTEE